jgi:hypothetical protein
LGYPETRQKYSFRTRIPGTQFAVQYEAEKVCREPAETDGAVSEPAPPADRSDSGTETIIRGGYTLTIEWGRRK